MELYSTISQERFIKLIVNFRNNCRNYSEFNIDFEKTYEINFFDAIQITQDDLYSEIEINIESFYSKLHPQAERIRYLSNLKNKIEQINRFNILGNIVPKSEINKIDWRQFINGNFNSNDISTLNINLDQKQIVNAIGLLHQFIREIIDFINTKINEENIIEINEKDDFGLILKKSLINNGFLELGKVSQLNTTNQEKLITIIVDPPVKNKKDVAPYRIAMLEFIGFLKHNSTRFIPKEKLNEFIGELIGIHKDNAKKLINGLIKKDLRYNTFEFLDTVKIDYNNIISGQ